MTLTVTQLNPSCGSRSWLHRARIWISVA